MFHLSPVEDGSFHTFSPPVNSIPEDKTILFLPDQFLGNHVKNITGRENMKIWMGECHVHAGITANDVQEAIKASPSGTIYVHPECGCTTSALYLASSGTVDPEQVKILSTGGMLDAIKKEAPGNDVMIATEIGLIHQLKKVSPNHNLIPVNPQASCKYMKMITLEKIAHCLETGYGEILIDEGTLNAARGSVERMILLGQPGTGE